MQPSKLAEWNALSADAAAEDILPCCGSRVWASAMASHRPLHTQEALTLTASETWLGLSETDWHEAFASHPRIGQRQAPTHASHQSAAWSAQEQSQVGTSDGAAKLAEANRLYEKRFGHIFLICANGLSATTILAALQARLDHDPATELRIAAEEQRRITHLRLQRWLTQGER